MRTRKWFVAVVAVCTFVIGYTVPSMGTNVTDGPHRYKLASDLGSGMPFRIVLNHTCNGYEDVLARLRLVRYDPPRKAVYRCVQP